LRLTAWGAICLLGVGTAACGGSETTQQTHKTPETTRTTTAAASPTASPPATARPTIDIGNFRFPESVTVPVGAQVTVINNDPDKHSVTSDAVGEFDVDIQPNSTATVTAPSEAGSYPYHCSYHSSMNGVLVVR